MRWLCLPVPPLFFFLFFSYISPLVPKLGLHILVAVHVERLVVWCKWWHRGRRPRRMAM